MWWQRGSDTDCLHWEKTCMPWRWLIDNHGWTCSRSLQTKLLQVYRSTHVPILVCGHDEMNETDRWEIPGSRPLLPSWSGGARWSSLMLQLDSVPRIWEIWKEGREVKIFGNTLLEGIVIIVSCHCHNSDMTLSWTCHKHYVNVINVYDCCH